MGLTDLSWAGEHARRGGRQSSGSRAAAAAVGRRTRQREEREGNGPGRLAAVRRASSVLGCRGWAPRSSKSSSSSSNRSQTERETDHHVSWGQPAAEGEGRGSERVERRDGLQEELVESGAVLGPRRLSLAVCGGRDGRGVQQEEAGRSGRRGRGRCRPTRGGRRSHSAKRGGLNQVQTGSCVVARMRASGSIGLQGAAAQCLHQPVPRRAGCRLVVGGGPMKPGPGVWAAVVVGDWPASVVDFLNCRLQRCSGAAACGWG